MFFFIKMLPYLCFPEARNRLDGLSFSFQPFNFPKSVSFGLSSGMNANPDMTFYLSCFAARENWVSFVFHEKRFLFNSVSSCLFALFNVFFSFVSSSRFAISLCHSFSLSLVSIKSMQIIISFSSICSEYQDTFPFQFFCSSSFPSSSPYPIFSLFSFLFSSFSSSCSHFSSFFSFSSTYSLALPRFVLHTPFYSPRFIPTKCIFMQANAAHFILTHPGPLL